jgi:hypothetical protein
MESPTIYESTDYQMESPTIYESTDCTPLMINFKLEKTVAIILPERPSCPIPMRQDFVEFKIDVRILGIKDLNVFFHIKNIKHNKKIEREFDAVVVYLNYWEGKAEKFIPGEEEDDERILSWCNELRHVTKCIIFRYCYYNIYRNLPDPPKISLRALSDPPDIIDISFIPKNYKGEVDDAFRIAKFFFSYFVKSRNGIYRIHGAT